jgi:hypothetical protein
MLFLLHALTRNQVLPKIRNGVADYDQKDAGLIEQIRNATEDI